MRYEKKKILRLFNSLSFFYLFFVFFFHFLLLVNNAKVENMRKKCPQGKKLLKKATRPFVGAFRRRIRAKKNLISQFGQTGCIGCDGKFSIGITIEKYVLNLVVRIIIVFALCRITELSVFDSSLRCKSRKTRLSKAARKKETDHFYEQCRYVEVKFGLQMAYLQS